MTQQVYIHQKDFNNIFTIQIALKIELEQVKDISHWPFCEFCPRIEFKRLWNFKLMAKLSETFMWCWKGPWEYKRIFRLYLHRYFRIRPRMSSNFSFAIFPKVYLTFQHNITPFSQSIDRRRPPGEAQGNFYKPGGTYSSLEKMKKEKASQK